MEADAAQIRLLLQASEFTGAAAVLNRMGCLDGTPTGVRVTWQLAVGRVLRAERRFPEALSSFRSTADLAWSAGQISAVVEAQVHAAILQQVMGQDDAWTTLHQALITAQDDGIVAPFLEDPRSVRPLLLAVEGSDQEFATRTFRRELLAKLDMPTPSIAGTSSNSVRRIDLTEREITVLRLLGGSLSGTEIADVLGISANTMKTHTRKIYAKLGVSSRRDAVRYASNGFHE